MDDQSRARDFGAWLLTAARLAGFDVDGPRGGGRTEIAERSGISLATVSRALSGQAIPDAKALEPLALAVGVQPAEAFNRAGLLSATAAAVRPTAPITPARALAALGVHDPADQAAVLMVIERLKARSAE